MSARAACALGGLLAAAVLVSVDAGFRLTPGRLTNSHLTSMARKNGRLANRRRLVEVNSEGDAVENGRQLSGDSKSDDAISLPDDTAPCDGGKWFDATRGLPSQPGTSAHLVGGLGVMASGGSARGSEHPGEPSINVSLASSLIRKGADGETWGLTRVCLRCRWGKFPAELPAAPATRFGRGQVCADIPLDPYAAFSPEHESAGAPDAALRLINKAGRRLPTAAETGAHPAGTCVQEAVARFGAEAVRTCLGPRAFVSSSGQDGSRYHRLCDARGALKGSTAGSRRSKMSLAAEASSSLRPSGGLARSTEVARGSFDIPVCSEAEAREARAEGAAWSKRDAATRQQQIHRAGSSDKPGAAANKAAPKPTMTGRQGKASPAKRQEAGPAEAHESGSTGAQDAHRAQPKPKDKPQAREGKSSRAKTADKRSKTG